MSQNGGIPFAPRVSLADPFSSVWRPPPVQADSQYETAALFNGSMFGIMPQSVPLTSAATHHVNGFANGMQNGFVSNPAPAGLSHLHSHNISRHMHPVSTFRESSAAHVSHVPMRQSGAHQLRNSAKQPPQQQSQQQPQQKQPQSQSQAKQQPSDPLQKAQQSDGMRARRRRPRNESRPSVREYNRRISAFARRRDLTGALRTLRELDESQMPRNLFTYNAVINALVMCAQHAKAEEMWRDMQGDGIQPNLVTFNTMLKSCFGGLDDDVARAFRLLEEMDERGISADRVTLNSVINACVSAGRVEDAQQVYHMMRRLNIEPDAYTFCTLAKQARHSRDVSMLDSLLLHQLHHHTQLQHRVDEKGQLNISPVAYNTIADAYIRCGHPDRAIQLLQRMRPRAGINVIPVRPDVQTYNVRVKALRESGASTSLAFAALDEMGGLGLEADHITLLTLADLCCRREEMGLAEGVLQAATDADIREIERGNPEWKSLCGRRRERDRQFKNTTNGRRNANQPRNAKANAALFNALIRGYSSLDPPNVERAVALYLEMRRYVETYGFSWYAADSVTYTMLVDAFARVGDAARAEMIVTEMEAAGRSNVVAYNAYLKANRGNGFKAALAILERMKHAGQRPDVVTYNTVIDFLSSEENGAAIAEDLVRKDMPRNGVKPDLLTFNTLIKGVARNRGNKSDAGTALGAAYKWLRELQTRGLKPDEFTYQSMVSACAAAGDAPRALDFFRKVETERAKRAQSGRGFVGSHSNVRRSGSPNASDWMLLPHPAAYVALMRAFLSSGAKDGVDSVLVLRDEMVARGLELGRTGFTAVADAYAQRGDFESVEATLGEMVAREDGKLGAVHHCIRMKALCNSGRLDDAIALLGEVEEADTAVFNLLIFACAKNRDYDRLMDVLRRMEAAGVEPDAITSRAMSSMMRNVARSLKTFDERFSSSITRFVSDRSDTHNGENSFHDTD